MMRIAFLGLGNMGAPMALNLLKAGHQLRVFDLVPEAVARLVDAGATAADSAGSATEGVDVVISMLPAGKHVAGTYLGEDGLLAALPSGSLVLDASTIDAKTAREVAVAAADRGIDFMDTPVSGGVAAAEAGTLAFMCGGTAEAFVRAKPVLAGMGNPDKIFHAGPSGSGQVAKAANNMLLAIHMIGTCEALAMGEANGLDPKVLSEIMKASSGNNWSLQVYNPWPGVMENAPASRDYQPGFMVDLMVKDLGLANEIADNSAIDNSLGRLALARYLEHQEAGNGAVDFSSILNLVRGEH
ncbi:MAG: 3-hydroxyisobutyrate dehydrogenase [Halieaceae bacterium]|jgi:3-hydroxyisobutyrate dehydrogenase|nr:3-hydroxyisobutyrate dehydrogenase [Halieaceae bacterium]